MESFAIKFNGWKHQWICYWEGSSDDGQDRNVVAKGSETIEPMVSYREALALLDKLSYVDGMSPDNIDILFLLREKIKKLSIQT